MSKKYPGAKSRESPLGKNWHHVETAGLTTAGECRVYVDPAGAVVLSWPRAEVNLTAPDADHDHSGPAALNVRLSHAGFQGLVSRGMVATAEGASL